VRVTVDSRSQWIDHPLCVWAINNRTPFAAERNWVRDRTGAHHWLVAVKVAFHIGPAGQMKLADEHPAPLLAPEYRGDAARTSVRADSDLLAVKPAPKTDLVLDACAHAPHGRPAATVPVSLQAGDVKKTLLVHGPRSYAAGRSTSAPVPFVSHPIIYEWAFGGRDLADPNPKNHRIDMRNPVGKGFAVDRNRLAGQPAHVVEYTSGTSEELGPAGFGPIDRGWSPRLALAGTYDARWAECKKPLLPDDYDDRFALSAPADQQALLRGGEIVALVNMTAEGTLSFELPKLAFRFVTRFGTRVEEHAARLATVFVEPEKRRVAMVWQTNLVVPARLVEQLDETTISEKRYLR
jgi:hypothetical protein